MSMKRAASQNLQPNLQNLEESKYTNNSNASEVIDFKVNSASGHSNTMKEDPSNKEA